MTPSFKERVGNVYRALAIKIIFLAVVFLVVPIIFYRLFQLADAQQTELLQTTVEEKGNLVAAALKQRLENFDTESPETMQRALDDLVSGGANIKILLRNDGNAGVGGFLYVAASPSVTSDYLEQERAQLVKIGVFDRLAPTCDGETTPPVRFTNPAGRAEILTSMTPVHIGSRCWVIITSQATDAILSTSIGQPVWRTPTIHIAAIIYFLSAVIVAWLFVDIWRNIDRFRAAARKIRTQGAGQVSFREMNTIPELTGVADDFDSLVNALKQSKDFIIQAAEENAHAFKAPLAVISQALEPLKRSTPETNMQAQRSLDLIERSITRLDLLVSAARDLEQATAEVIYPDSRRIDLSSYLSQLIAAYEATMVGRQASAGRDQARRARLCDGRGDGGHRRKPAGECVELHRSRRHRGGDAERRRLAGATDGRRHRPWRARAIPAADFRAEFPGPAALAQSDERRRVERPLRPGALDRPQERRGSGRQGHRL